MNHLPAPLRQVDRTFVLFRRRRLSYFGGCDYYRLASHPQVVAAARATIEAEGFGVAASRVTTGNHPLHLALESWLARFLRAARVILVGTGYAANPIAAQALAGEITHALLDAKAHSSLADALPFLDCPVQTFRHLDPLDLRRRLDRLPRRSRPLVLTDGLFGRDGAVAPLAAYLDCLPERGRLLLDEAHAAGVLGAGGRGTLEACGVADPRVIRTGTLSKAFGSFGGFVLADAGLANRVLSRSPWFAASTPIPLPAAAAALAAGKLIASDAAMRRRLRDHAAMVKSAIAQSAPMPNHEATPILAVIPSTRTDATGLRTALLRRGIFPSLIRYPGGPRRGYLRLAISSEHSREQLEALLGVLGQFAG